jgi:tetratricopeptide (TPR) repeat protein
MKLVDYDCMFVPALKHLKSNELGHRNYQHPHRSRDHFFAGLDRFSAWSIHTSLFCIAKDPLLWTKLNGGDDCLLFKLHDYKHPNESHTFRTLEHHESAEIRDAARRLRKLLSLSIQELPPLGSEVDGIDELAEIEEPINLPNWLMGDAHGTALTFTDTANGATRSPAEVLEKLSRTVASTTATFTPSGTAPRLVPPVMLPPAVSTPPTMKLSGLPLPPQVAPASAGSATTAGSYPSLPGKPAAKNILYTLTFPGIVIIILLLCLFVAFLPVIFKFGDYAVRVAHSAPQPSTAQPASPIEPAYSLFYEASDLVARHDYNAAIAKFEASLARFAANKNESGQERCMYEIAKCFELARDRTQSLAWMESALEQYPNTPVAKQEYPVVGKLYFDEGNLTKAASYLAKSLEWNNITDRDQAFESSKLLRQIGLQLMEEKQSRGLEAYQQALTFEDLNHFRNPVEYYQQLRDAAKKLEKEKAYELATKVWWQAYQSTIDYPGDEHAQRLEALNGLKRIAEIQGDKVQIEEANWRIADYERKYQNRKERKRHRQPPDSVPNPRERKLPSLD